MCPCRRGGTAARNPPPPSRPYACGLTMRISALPYCPDSAERIEAIADEPWSVFLDSGRPRSTMGRFAILAARPYVTLVPRGGMTEIRDRARPTLSPADPFELLRRYLAADGHPPALPFAGGAIGYFGYDLARRIEQLPSHARAAEAIPGMAVGIYDWAVIVDHAQRARWLVGYGRGGRARGRGGGLGGQVAGPPPLTARRPFQVGPV